MFNYVRQYNNICILVMKRDGRDSTLFTFYALFIIILVNCIDPIDLATDEPVTKIGGGRENYRFTRPLSIEIEL